MQNNITNQTKQFFSHSRQPWKCQHMETYSLPHPSHPPQILLGLSKNWTTLLKISVTFEWTQETSPCFTRTNFMCRQSSKSHWIALIRSDKYRQKGFRRRAQEGLMNDWFGCQYISLQRPIGEITGFKCRLLLCAVPVHYLKKNPVLRNVEHREELTHYASHPFLK